MGYYAKGDGYLTVECKNMEEAERLVEELKSFSSKDWSCCIPEEDVKTIEDVASAIWYILYPSNIDIKKDEDGRVDPLAPVRVEIDGYYELSKWYDDDYTDTLESISAYCVNGELKFIGDEDCMWRYVFKDGHWVDEYGMVVYEGERYLKVADILEILDESLIVKIVSDDGKSEVYDNKNIVDERFGECEVLKISAQNFYTVTPQNQKVFEAGVIIYIKQ